MPLLERPFSDLINKPRLTVEALTGSWAHSVRLRRRDDIDLVLTTATRYEQDHAVITAAARLFAAVMREQSAAAQALMLRVLPEVFPWVRFLPAEDIRQFLVELVETLRGADDLDNFAPVTQLIAAWQHTAEVHADPELAATLRQDADDLGPVPAPVAHS